MACGLYARQQGARSVVGVDLSEQMLAQGKDDIEAGSWREQPLAPIGAVRAIMLALRPRARARV